MRSLVRLAVVVGMATAAGCGPTAGNVIAEEPGPGGPSPYDGPLYVEVSNLDDPDVVKRSGAAGRALECDGDPGNGSTAANYGLRAEPGNSAADALASYLRADAYGLPVAGYRLERSDSERVLMSFDVAGRTRVAVVLHLENDRWQVETFAHCDPSEFPAAVELPFDVWSDDSGRRLSTTIVRSEAGPEHCGWQTATFLSLDGRLRFVRDPEEVVDREAKRGDFASHSPLPVGATDTGYRLGDQALWLTGDGGAAYVVREGNVERWPALPEYFGCD